MDSEPIASPDVGNHKITQETIRLPLENNEFIHIQAEPTKLAQAFSDFASQFGVDEAEAKTFFANKVDFKFGEVGKLSVPGVGRFDQVLSDALGKLKGSKPLGAVVPNNERYTLCLDTQAIAQALPNFQTCGLKIPNYTNMALGQKIVSFEQAVKSLTEHEFFHLIQFMKNPQKSIKASKQVLQAMRLMFTYTASFLTTIALFPHEGGSVMSAATPFVMGAIIYLNRDQAKVEKDAYDAQKKALQLNLKNPYIFTHETG